MNHTTHNIYYAIYYIHAIAEPGRARSVLVSEIKVVVVKNGQCGVPCQHLKGTLTIFGSYFQHPPQNVIVRLSMLI